jgi:hypothetical protein
MGNAMKLLRHLSCLLFLAFAARAADANIAANNLLLLAPKAAPTFTGSATFSYLTSGRIPIISTDGLLTDSSAFQWLAGGGGTITAGTFVGALTGNASTATSAATLTTPRAIYGNNFDGSAALTQIIASTYGGTGNGFTKFSGPTTSEKTFTLPDASATIATLDMTHPTTTALTYSGTNVTLTASSRATYNRTLTLTNDCLLTITTTDGANGVITLVPDSSSTYTVYLHSGIRMLGVAGSGSFAVTNSATETVVIAWQASLRGGSAFTAATKAVYP